jgi:hypothetical protein
MRSKIGLSTTKSAPEYPESAVLPHIRNLLTQFAHTLAA